MRELIPDDFLRAIGIWSLIPSYLLAGGLLGYGLDRLFGTFPYLVGVGLIAGLILAVRDMGRLRDVFQKPTPPTAPPQGE